MWHNYKQSKCGMWPSRLTLGLGHMAFKHHHVAPRVRHVAFTQNYVAFRLSHMAPKLLMGYGHMTTQVT
jgi:hypothetical protein